VLEALEARSAYAAVSLFGSGGGEDGDEFEVAATIGVEEPGYEIADALSSIGPALGALDAARFLAGKPPRLYTMSDLLG